MRDRKGRQGEELLHGAAVEGATAAANCEVRARGGGGGGLGRLERDGALSMTKRPPNIPDCLSFHGTAATCNAREGGREGVCV
jgi:hypothetical protein